MRKIKKYSSLIYFLHYPSGRRSIRHGALNILRYTFTLTFYAVLTGIRTDIDLRGSALWFHFHINPHTRSDYCSAISRNPRTSL